MSIEVRVPDEIKNYKENIIAGLSIRQLICGAVALALGVPTFLLLNKINTDLATYSTMAIVAPAFCVGFIKKDGHFFEQYLKIRLKAAIYPKKRQYRTQPTKNILPLEIDRYRTIFNNDLTNLQKRGEKFAFKKRKIRKLIREQETAEISKKSSARKRKAAYKCLKAAERKY